VVRGRLGQCAKMAKGRDNDQVGAASTMRGLPSQSKPQRSRSCLGLGVCSLKYWAACSTSSVSGLTLPSVC
jgi:hypothetical protein